jgi:uncharacterized membrane protein
MSWFNEQKIYRSLIIIAIIILSCSIGVESLWGDEAWTIKFANSELPDLFTQIKEDVHPPVYFITMHFWTKLVPINEFTMRLPSLLFALVSIFLFYHFCKNIKTPPLIGTALFSLSLSGLVYAHEARSYSLIIFLALSSWLSLNKIINGNNKYPLISYCTFTISNILLLYTHVLGIVIWAGTILFVVLSFNKKIYFEKRFLISNSLLIGSFAPWFFAFMTQIINFLPLLLERLTLKSNGLITPLLFWILFIFGTLITIFALLIKITFKDNFSLIYWYKKTIILLRKEVWFFLFLWIIGFVVFYNFFSSTNPFVRYLLFLQPLIYLSLTKIITKKKATTYLLLLFSLTLLFHNATNIDRFEWKNAVPYALSFDDENTFYGLDKAGTSYYLFEHYGKDIIPNINKKMIKFHYVDIVKSVSGEKIEDDIYYSFTKIDPKKNYVLILSKLKGEQSKYKSYLKKNHELIEEKEFEDIKVLVFKTKQP